MPSPTEPAVEPVNPELDALLLNAPDDAAAWLVYRDWLGQQGDPRAELMRLQALEPAKDHQQFIDALWSLWFGALPSEGLRFTWRNGFVEKAQLYRAASKVSLRSLLERRSMHFLRALTIDSHAEFAGTLDGLELPPALQRVDLAAPSADALVGKTLSSLEELRLQVRSPLAGLPATLQLPAIRRVALGQGGGIPIAELVVELARSPWLARLQSLELGQLGPDDARALLDHREDFLHLGAGLVVHATEPALQSHRANLRAAFPASTLVPIPSLAQEDASFRFHLGGPSAYAAPRHAPPNFRELPPKVNQPVRNEYHSWFGSGLPFTRAHALDYHFSRCMGCASAETLCIYECWQSSYSNRRAETDHFKRLEYLCRECGRFSSYEASWES